MEVQREMELLQDYRLGNGGVSVPCALSHPSTPTPAVVPFFPSTVRPAQSRCQPIRKHIEKPGAYTLRIPRGGEAPVFMGGTKMS